MKKEFHAGNRARLYDMMKPNSLLVLFSGREKRKTNDEYYPFYTSRNFIYLTGLDSKEFILLAMKDDHEVKEEVFILPADFLAERWTGTRLKEAEVRELSGIETIQEIAAFAGRFHRLALSGNYSHLYLDLYKAAPGDEDTPAFDFSRKAAAEYPQLRQKDACALIKKLRLIKQPCEIAAMREAEKITKAGIEAMMKASRPGMYEYQYKAEFDHALGQFGPQGPAFPSIISAGKNNFCIHYYSYTGQAHDGDMILNDVGGYYDNVMTDVSRGWPCNGRYSERQKLLYSCAYATSNHMFEIVKPGMKMADVDRTIRSYNAERLKDAGVLADVKDIGTYMWHGGAHHVGYDVHDVVETPEIIAPGMVFCIDVGIYHEEWGIGFRLEDNCLVTEDGCENLSRDIPREISQIEDFMKK